MNDKPLRDLEIVIRYDGVKAALGEDRYSTYWLMATPELPSNNSLTEGEYEEMVSLLDWTRRDVIDKISRLRRERLSIKQELDELTK
jgi:hypothetical protein